MTRLGIIAVLCCSRGILAQTPPAPGAVLVAGSTPARLGALDVPIRAGSIALAPDGGLFAAESNRVWRVSPDGFLSEVAGPWNPGQVLINSITVDKAGNLY